MAESNDLDNDDFCYICFEGATRGPAGELEPLVQVCRCPTRVHRRCVARWQLYSAGKREEKSCRFCQGTLPDWKEVLTPRALPAAVPVLSIYYNNTCCRMKVRPGPDGLRAFLRQLEVIVGRDASNVNFVFRCRCPDTGAEIFLHGLQAFEAAMHCACVRAAQRSLQQQLQQQQRQEHLTQLISPLQQQQHQQAGLPQQQERVILPPHERRRQQQQLLLQHCELLQRQQHQRQDDGGAGVQSVSYATMSASIADPRFSRVSAHAARVLYGTPSATVGTHTGTTIVSDSDGRLPVRNDAGRRSALDLFPFISEVHSQMPEGIRWTPESDMPEAVTIAASVFPQRTAVPPSVSAVIEQGCSGLTVPVGTADSGLSAACGNAVDSSSTITGLALAQQRAAPSVSASRVAVELQSHQEAPLMSQTQSPPTRSMHHHRHHHPALVRPVMSLSGALYGSDAATARVMSHCAQERTISGNEPPRTISSGDSTVVSVTSAQPMVPMHLEQANLMVASLATYDVGPYVSASSQPQYVAGVTPRPQSGVLTSSASCVERINGSEDIGSALTVPTGTVALVTGRESQRPAELSSIVPIRGSELGGAPEVISSSSSPIVPDQPRSTATALPKPSESRRGGVGICLIHGWAPNDRTDGGAGGYGNDDGKVRKRKVLAALFTLKALKSALSRRFGRRAPPYS